LPKGHEKQSRSLLPPYSEKLWASDELLQLAAPLEDSGYEVSLIDAAIEPNYLKRIS
jgi:hypothetical protein